MQGIGSTVTSESWTKRDGMGYSQEAQTFKDIHEDSLSSDTMSEEFPLLVAPLPSRTEIYSEEIHTSCEEDTVQRQGDEFQPPSKRSRRVRRAPKKFTPNSNKNKVYYYCQKEDSGWYLRCDFAYPGCLQYYHAKCVGLEKLTDKVLKNTATAQMVLHMLVLHVSRLLKYVTYKKTKIIWHH